MSPSLNSSFVTLPCVTSGGCGLGVAVGSGVAVSAGSSGAAVSVAVGAGVAVVWAPAPVASCSSSPVELRMMTATTAMTTAMPRKARRCARDIPENLASPACWSAGTA